METNLLNELIDETIRLERNVAALYEIFSNAIDEDGDFWWQFHLEERSHATLLRTAKDSFVKRGLFPEDIVVHSINALKASNERVEQKAQQCKAVPPTRREACAIALTLEHEAGEQHYQQFMEKAAETSTESVFQQLNREDKEHERRIREHMDSLPADA